MVIVGNRNSGGLGETACSLHGDHAPDSTAEEGKSVESRVSDKAVTKKVDKRNLTDVTDLGF